MSGLLLGSYDPSARCGLQVSHGGLRPQERDVLCLFDGHLDNAEEIATELGAPTRAGAVESLLAEGYRRWGRGCRAGCAAISSSSPGIGRGARA